MKTVETVNVKQLVRSRGEMSVEQQLYYKKITEAWGVRNTERGDEDVQWRALQRPGATPLVSYYGAIAGLQELGLEVIKVFVPPHIGEEQVTNIAGVGTKQSKRNVKPLKAHGWMQELDWYCAEGRFVGHMRSPKRRFSLGHIEQLQKT